MQKVLAVTLLWVSLVVAGFPLWQRESSAEVATETDTSAKLKEMPVLRGELWQKMTHDEKVAFIWGMGHVVTIERESMRMHPQLVRDSLAASLSRGIAGKSMNRIIDVIDDYYRDNPAGRDEPVLQVLWDKLVRPKISVPPPDLSR